MGNVVELRPFPTEDFWLHLEVALEFLRDGVDGGNLLHAVLRDDYAKLADKLELDIAENAARWAMLRYALDVCK